MPKTVETASELVQATRSRIIELLEERGMTIVQLANAAGISEGGFHSRFREGSIQLKVLGDFARALGVPVGHLLPASERGEVIRRRMNDRPYVEDRLEAIEREIRVLKAQLRK